MEIRKTFKFEGAHLVRNAWSRRCAYSIHGHSYIVEVFLGSSQAHPDQGQMLIDFGLIKQYLNDLIDSFDHATFLWNRSEDQHIIDFFQKEFERVIVLPYSTTAEMQSKMFFYLSKLVLMYLTSHNELTNGEGKIEITRVRVHETATGYAEYTREDVRRDFFPEVHLRDMSFSASIRADWKFWNNERFEKLLEFSETSRGLIV